MHASSAATPSELGEAGCEARRSPETGVERGAGRAARSYTYTAEDVARMVAAKRARGGGGRNRAAEKARLLRLREHARESGAAEELAECARSPALPNTCTAAGRKRVRNDACAEN